MAGCPQQLAAGRRTALKLALALAAALGLVTCAGATAAGAVAPLGGVNVPGITFGARSAQADRSIATARALHAKIVRAEVPWAVLEPNAAGVLDPRALAYADRLVADAAASGIGVIMTVDGTPCWTSSAPASLLRQCRAGRQSQANAWPPRDAAAYASFVALLAQRYGTRLAAIEIWNEPDQANQLYFAGPEKPQRYAAILRAAYPAIKRANARVPVLAGSLVGSNGVFLRALYAAGIKGYYDGLAVHFYNLVLGSLRAIHQTQLANGDDKPLWLDEFGWSSCWPRERIQQEQACVTRRLQGANLTDILRSLARTTYVAAEAVYDLQDNAAEDFGVLSAMGGRKPAFAPLARTLASPFGRPTAVSLRLRTHSGRVLASGAGPAGDYMQLEAFQGRTLRYRALFVLDRFNRFSLTLPRVLGTHLRVRVFQYWAGVAHATQKRI